MKSFLKTHARVLRHFPFMNHPSSLGGQAQIQETKKKQKEHLKESFKTDSKGRHLLERKVPSFQIQMLKKTLPSLKTKKVNFLQNFKTEHPVKKIVSNLNLLLKCLQTIQYCLGFLKNKMASFNSELCQKKCRLY